MQYNIAIVVVTYNRPTGLQRLLSSLTSACYEPYTAIPLIISVDYSGNQSCTEVASQFEWAYGEKKVIHHGSNLGLKQHVLLCGELTQQYDGIILLEDDLFVSPCFYDYAQQAYRFYRAEPHIAGIALYHNSFNEVAGCPFEPIHDGFDNYFMQVPCSWGQLWTKEQWNAFALYTSQPIVFSSNDFLPDTVLLWPSESSWKKVFYKYLTEQQKYFVYPRIGLSTNFGDAGEHVTQSSTVFQTPLLFQKKNFQFSTLSASLSIYDGFYEMDKKVFNKIMKTDQDVSFDLNGTKPLHKITTRYMVSGKKCHHPIEQYCTDLYPYENNVLMGLKDTGGKNDGFSMGEVISFSDEKAFNRSLADLRRIFLHTSQIEEAIWQKAVKTSSYRAGHLLLAPLRFLKKLFKR